MNKYEEALQEILQLSNFIVNAKSVPDIYMYQGQGVRISLCAQKLLEIVNRSTPMKPVDIRDYSNPLEHNLLHGQCAQCGFWIVNAMTHDHINYCNVCGQAIDWSEEK